MASIVARAALKRTRISRQQLQRSALISTSTTACSLAISTGFLPQALPVQGSSSSYHDPIFNRRMASSQALQDAPDDTVTAATSSTSPPTSSSSSANDLEVAAGSSLMNATTKNPKEKDKISKKDMAEEESKRWRLSDVPIKDILKAKHSNRWVDPVISKKATLKQAVEIMIEGGLSAAMVTDDDKKHVVGLVTSRDLLRCIALGIKEEASDAEMLDRVIGDTVMTPIGQVIYARPEESVGMCRTIMAKLGIKCLPVLSRDGRVEGLITARDMSQYRFSAEDKGGKKSYLNDVSERVGLGSNTSMADPPAFMQAHLALEQTPLFMNVGVAELPHPYKTEDGVGMNHRGE